MKIYRRKNIFCTNAHKPRSQPLRIQNKTESIIFIRTYSVILLGYEKQEGILILPIAAELRFGKHLLG